MQHIREGITGLIALFTCLLLASCTGHEDAHKAADGANLVRFGTYNGDTASLVLYADSEKHFAQASVNVQLKMFQSGKAATDALLAGEVDVATAAEFVIAKNIFKHPELRIIATIATSTPNYLLVNTEIIPDYPESIKGKRFGVVMGSATEFYLAQHLSRLGIDLHQDIEIQDHNPQTLAAMFGRGELDALALWNPHVYRLHTAHPDTSQQFPLNNTQDMFFVVVSTQQWLQDNRKSALGLLEGLLKAQEQLRGQALDSWLSERFNYDLQYVNHVKNNQKLGLSLNRALVRAVETEKKWLQKILYPEDSSPDTEQMIESSLLHKLAPHLVSLD